MAVEPFEPPAHFERKQSLSDRWARPWAIFRHNVRLLLGDPGPIMVFFVTPMLVMAVMRPTYKFLLVNGEGFPNANGSEHAVPGFVVMFTFFWIGFVGRNFISEHGWGTWERLRASFASPREVMIGKILPAFVLIFAQVVILFILGSIVFDLNSEGPILSLAVVALPLVTCVLALCLALVGLSRTLSQIDAFGNMLTMMFASIGGSLVPIASLPAFVQDISPGTPTYWVINSSQQVILEGEGLSATLPAAGALLGFTALFATLALLTFKFSETKVAT